MRRALVMCLTVGALLALSAPASATPAAVDINDYAFMAPDVRVAPGETVTWRFRAADSHNVKSDAGQAETFLSGVPRVGGPDFVRRFDKVGRFTYFCELHPEMIGSVAGGRARPDGARPHPPERQPRSLLRAGPWLPAPGHATALPAVRALHGARLHRDGQAPRPAAPPPEGPPGSGPAVICASGAAGCSPGATRAAAGVRRRGQPLGDQARPDAGQVALIASLAELTNISRA